MKKALIAFATILAIAAGCSKENFESLSITRNGSFGGKSVATATIASDLDRATLDVDDLKQVWVEGDCIGISNKTDAGHEFAKFTLVSGEGTSEGEFESADEVGKDSVYYAVYPYSSTSTITVAPQAPASISVQYPSRLTFDEDFIVAEGPNFMVARSKDKEKFYFRNICSYIQMTVTGPDDIYIQSLILRSADGSAINGNASITFNGDSPVVEFDGSGTDVNFISCGEDGFPFADEPFSIAVPPTLENGFSITIVATDGQEMTVSSSNPVGRNTIMKMPTIEFAPVAVECAEIGQERYTSIAEAVNAANDLGEACTIRIIDDCHITSDAEFKNEDAAVTFDLNGHSVTGISDFNLKISETSEGVVITDSQGTGSLGNADSNTPAVESYGILTVESGTIKGGNCAVKLHSGSFTMNGGTLESIGTTTSGRTLRVDSESGDAMDSIEINGGEIKSNKYGIYVSYCEKVTINDCKITSDGCPVYISSGTAEIKSGIFTSYSSQALAAGASADAEISGGYFTSAPNYAIISGAILKGGYYSRSVNNDLVAAGYFSNICDITYEGLHYSYIVEPKPQYEATIKVGEADPINKTTIAEALLMANQQSEDCLITLLSDCRLTEKIPVASDNAITLDLAGKTLITNSDKRFEINGTNSNLTIRSSVEDGRVQHDHTGSAVVLLNKGTFTLESGELLSAAKAAYYTLDAKGGTVNVKGGKIYGEYYEAASFTNSKAYISGGELVANYTGEESKNTLAAIYFGTGADVHISGGKMNNAYFSSNITGLEFTSGGTISIDTLTTYGNVILNGGKFDPIVFSPMGSAIKVEINGGEFTATGSKSAVTKVGSGVIDVKNGSFTADKGFALDVQVGTANVSGGEFTSAYGGIRTSTTTNISGTATVAVSGAEGAQAFALYLGNSKIGPGKFNISGGKFTSSYRGLHRYSGDFSISGGTFAAGEQTINAGNLSSPIVEIKGGYFSSTCDTTGIFVGKNFENTVSTGCWFSKAIDESYLKTGCTLDSSSPVTIDGITYTHQVVGQYYAASLNGTGYATFEAALEEANKLSEPGTIKLLDDIVLQDTARFTNTIGITLDLAGKEMKGGVYCINPKGGNLTIDDSSDEKTGKIEASGNYVVYVSNGGAATLKEGAIKNTAAKGAKGGKGIYCNGGTCTLNIDGGSVTTTDSAAVALYAAKCNITGGKITSKNPNDAATAGSTCYLGTVAARNAANLTISGDAQIENTAGIALYSYYGSSTTKTANVTITGGTITSTAKDAIYASTTTLEISGGTITAKDSSAIVLYRSKATISGDATVKSSMKAQASSAKQDPNAHFGAVSVIQSTLDMEGGSITNDEAIALYSYGTANYPCTVNVSGGAITGIFHGIYPYFRSTINVTGGAIESTYTPASDKLVSSTSAPIYTNMTSNTTINVSGGYFKSASNYVLRSAGENSGKAFVITGGKYNKTPEQDAYIKVADGYSVKDLSEGDYKFEVTKD